MKPTCKFSFFQGGINQITPLNAIGVKELHHMIISDKYKKEIEAYRKTGDEKYKKSLDYICPSGIFSKRSNVNLISHSGLISIDIDSLESNDRAEELKMMLEYVEIEPCLIFVSPSGKGLKVLFFIDLDSGEHKKYFKALTIFFKNVLEIEIDQKCGEISRAAFLSFDPNAYINLNAMALNEDFLNIYPGDIDPIKITSTSMKNNLDLCNNDDEAIRVMTLALEKEHTFIEGNRHDFILRLASGFNRVGISMETSLTHILNKYPEDGFDEEEIIRTVKSAYKRTDFFGVAPLNLGRRPEEVFSEATIDINFPTQGLPEVLLKFATDISDVYGVPIEFPIMSCFVAISSVLKKSYSVDCGKYINFPQFWVIQIAPSGVGKSEQLAIAFRPIKELDKKHYDHFKLSRELWRQKCVTAKKEKRTEPEKPFFKQLTVDDSTPEALYQVMQRNGGGVTLCRDELSGWILDFGRYSKSGEVARYLSIFNNDQFVINRKGDDEPLVISSPFMSIIGGIQPEVLDNLLKQYDLIANGFASRFLFVYPDIFKKQFYSERIPDKSLYNSYRDLIIKLSEDDGSRQFILSAEAKELFIQFSNEMTEHVNNSANPFLKASYSKMDIHCLRLSLLIEVVKQQLTNEVSVDSMQYAIDLCRYFSFTAEKIASRQLKKDTVVLNKLNVAKFLIDECDCSQNEAAKAVKLSQPYLSKKLRNKVIME
jgi:hypothetical protein